MSKRKKKPPGNEEEWIGTEEQWVSASDPEGLFRTLFFLGERNRIQVSQRKWVLLMVACLWRVQHVFQDDRSRTFVDSIERFAEGLLTREDVDRFGLRTVDPPNPDNRAEETAATPEQLRVAYAWDALVTAGPPHEGYRFPRDAERVASATSTATTRPEQESRVQAVLVRDIVGNPFRATPLAPAVRTPVAVDLARTAYEERSSPARTLSESRLAVLADALEEAGCTDSQILSHCRGAGPHARGCWVVDLILGKS